MNNLNGSLQHKVKLSSEKAIEILNDIVRHLDVEVRLWL